MSIRRIAVLSCALVLGLVLAGSAFGQGARKPVNIEGKQTLPLRVLARPFANVYKAPDEAQGTVMENVAAFEAFYVYTRPSPEEIEMERGWYEVGSDNRGTVIGWMKTDDVFEWKQAMCLAYTHPEGRSPVLMFETRTPLESMVAASADARKSQAQGYYSTIDSGRIPADFPVVSVEPKKAVDISEQFYLLPILDFLTMEMDGREGRILELAAVTKAGPDAREETDIRENQEYLSAATESSTAISSDELKNLKVDIVWVADTTVSMRPYIDRTLQVIRDVSEEIHLQSEISQNLRFGIWGYRDAMALNPDVGYGTNNYTPALQPIAEFMQTMATVDVTQVSTKGYAEDVFSGVSQAIMDTSWSDNSLRFMILIGDAPGHELGDPANVSGQDELTLRSVANDNRVYLFAVHIKNPKAKAQYNDLGEVQFKQLSKNKGTPDSAYWNVSSEDLDGFSNISLAVADTIVNALQEASQGLVSGQQAAAPAHASGMAPAAVATPVPAPAPAPVPTPVQGDELAGIADVQTTSQQVVRAALVEWIGSTTNAKPPRDIVAWATDKDLMNPAIQAMDVRLLINKRQLDSLKTVLDGVMAAGLRGQIGGEDFFDALQATAATAARDPEQIKNAQVMADTGLVPEFLDGLPYKSRLMDMSNELWASWSIDEQDEFLNQLDARIKTYQHIYDNPDGWIELNKGDDPGDYVYPISLDLLP